MNNREAFEAWIKKNYFNATEALAKQDNGNYYFHEASEKWTVWQAAIASQAQQPKMGSDSENILRLIATIQYMVGIAERGLGKKCNDDQMPERFLLDYVKSLEAQTQQTKKVMCEACHGSGYFDSDKDFDCQVCNGKGYLQSQAQQESQWISVEERLPEMETPVVAMVGKNIYALARVDYDEGWLWAICGCDLSDIRDYEADDDYQPTYWMPLAIPPSPEGDKPCEQK